MKSNVVRALAALGVAGAFLAAAPAAQAQHVSFGVAVGGGPQYYRTGPVYRGPGFGYGRPYGYDHYRYEEWRRHEEWVHHQEWLRAHEYGYRPYYGR